MDTAKIWLQKQAGTNRFSIGYIENTEKIDNAFLSRYQLFVQLDYSPNGWTPTAVAAFTKYIEEGRGEQSVQVVESYSHSLEVAFQQRSGRAPRLRFASVSKHRATSCPHDWKSQLLSLLLLQFAVTADQSIG